MIIIIILYLRKLFIATNNDNLPFLGVLPSDDAAMRSLQSARVSCQSFI